MSLFLFWIWIGEIHSADVLRDDKPVHIETAAPVSDQKEQKKKDDIIPEEPKVGVKQGKKQPAKKLQLEEEDFSNKSLIIGMGCFIAICVIFYVVSSCLKKGKDDATKDERVPFKKFAVRPDPEISPN